MDAVIVDAGMGNCLQELTFDKPKYVLDINGVSLFEKYTEKYD